MPSLQIAATEIPVKKVSCSLRILFNYLLLLLEESIMEWRTARAPGAPTERWRGGGRERGEGGVERQKTCDKMSWFVRCGVDPYTGAHVHAHTRIHAYKHTLESMPQPQAPWAPLSYL